MISLGVVRPLAPALMLAFTACGGNDPAAVDPPPEKSAELAAPRCGSLEGRTAVAPSPDGARVAFISCTDAGARAVIHDFESGDEITLADAVEGASIEWLGDKERSPKFILFGTAEDLAVVPDDASAAPTRVADGTVLHHRAISQKQPVSNLPEPRLLVLADEGGEKRLGVLDPEDGYQARKVLFDCEPILGDLARLSTSGRTLIVTVRGEGEEDRYVKLLTDGSDTRTLSFGSKSWTMAPVGIGDKHNYVLNGDRLARIVLETGAVMEVVPPDSGLLAGGLLRRQLYFLVTEGAPRAPSLLAALVASPPAKLASRVT
jgi:hypothetical protein